MDVDFLRDKFDDVAKALADPLRTVHGGARRTDVSSTSPFYEAVVYWVGPAVIRIDLRVEPLEEIEG